MEQTDRISRSDRVVFRRLASEEGGVLLHLDTGAYHGLNPLGALIWDLIGSGTSLGELTDSIRSRVENAPDHLDDDVREFVADLLARELIVSPE